VKRLPDIYKGGSGCERETLEVFIGVGVVSSYLVDLDGARLKKKKRKHEDLRVGS
jgi:hypothetical protein